METCSVALSLSLSLEFCLFFSLSLFCSVSFFVYYSLSFSLSFLLSFSIYIAMTDEKFCLLRSSFIAYRFGFEIDEDSLPLTPALTPHVTPTVTPAATTASAPVPTASLAVPLLAVLSKGSSNATSSIRVLANDSNNNYNGERGKTEGERERERERVGEGRLLGWPLNCTTAAVSALELIWMWHPRVSAIRFSHSFPASH